MLYPSTGSINFASLITGQIVEQNAMMVSFLRVRVRARVDWVRFLLVRALLFS